jgi:hypothetical protein
LAAKQCAALIDNATIVEYDCSHMAVYTGDTFERAVTDQISFLRDNI